MPRQYKPKPRGKRHISHKKEDIDRALEDKRINNLSYRAAASKHNIECTVLFRHATQINVKNLGGQTVLGPDIENIIVENVNACSEWGYPLDKYGLRLLVKNFLDKKGVQCKRFNNNMPGVDFAIGFFKRHKNKISEKYAQNIVRTRANGSAETINNYFDELEKKLKDVPEKNLINYDETNLTVDPGKKHVIEKRGSKYPESALNTTNCSISLMMAGTADGYLFPPYVIYKAQNLYDSWTSGGPKGTRYNKTSSGWIDIITFEDWIKTIVIPYSKETEGPIYLIGDNLSCHLSLDVITICKKNNIHLVLLPPNTTHLLQPLDVAFFQPLTMAWKKTLLLWKKREGHKEKCLPKSVFPRFLKYLFSIIGPNAKINIRSGFRKTGINPLNRQEVLSRLTEYFVDDSLKSMRYYYSEEEQPVRKKKKLDVASENSVDDNIVTVKNTTEKDEPQKTQKNNEEKDSRNYKKTEEKEMDGKNSHKQKDKSKSEFEINETESASNKIAVDFKPKAGPYLLMCQICHCLKNQDDDTWITCIVCYKEICRGCFGDVIEIEFICRHCCGTGSEDSNDDDEDDENSLSDNIFIIIKE